jgi:outer membrane lipoprotein-sorting protein
MRRSAGGATWAVSILLCAALVAGAAGAGDLEPAPQGVDPHAVALRAEEAQRSDRTYIAAEMTIVSPRLASDRVVAFENWDDRPGKRSFIHIENPAKDAGTTFLKLHPNLWMYIPRVERTMRIPPSMMLQSWMGSDFTNDDLVRESSELDDYDHRLLGIDPGSDGEGKGKGDGEEAGEPRAYVVEYKPHEDAPVVWGKILMWLDVETGAPLRQDFYDEEGSRLRVMRFGDFRQIGKRNVPHHWSMTPLEKSGHSTTIEVDEMQYDLEIDKDVFTTRNLKRSD